MLDDDITDEEMMALAAATGARTTTQTAPAWSSTNAGAAASAPAHRSFQSAFASMTTSSHYTSVANMPMPPPPPPSAAPAAGGAAAAAAAAGPASRAVRPGGGIGPAGVPKAQSAHAILVSPRQRGNPVLGHISNVAWELGPRDMSADYVIGDTCGALYLSLKYHLLHGNYVASRMAACGSSFTLRVLLLLVDVDDSERPLLDLSKLCFAHGWTLVCCWSPEETARYLETLKAYEKKTSAAIEERVDHADHAATLLDAITQVRSINKTDVRHLLTNFGSFAGLAQASKEELAGVPGMGERKVHRLHHVFNQPFITSQMRLRTDTTSSVTTPAQAAAAHAAAMAKAAAAAAVPPKRTPIVMLNQMPSAVAPPAATAAAAAPATSAPPAAFTLPAALSAVPGTAASSPPAAAATAAAPSAAQASVAGRPPLPSAAAATASTVLAASPAAPGVRPTSAVAQAPAQPEEELSDFSDFVTR